MRLTRESNGVSGAGSQTQRSSGRALARAMSYVAWVAVFLLASFLAANLLHWGTREATGAVSPPSLQAWLNQPSSVAKGVRPGTPLNVTVRSGVSTAVAWTAADAAQTIGSGHLTLSPGKPQTFRVRTVRARHRTWVVIQVSGIPTPLRAWMR